MKKNLIYLPHVFVISPNKLLQAVHAPVGDFNVKFLDIKSPS